MAQSSKFFEPAPPPGEAKKRGPLKIFFQDVDGRRLHEWKKLARAKKNFDRNFFLFPGSLFFLLLLEIKIFVCTFSWIGGGCGLKNAALSQGQSNRIFFGVGTRVGGAAQKFESCPKTRVWTIWTLSLVEWLIISLDYPYDWLTSLHYSEVIIYKNSLSGCSFLSLRF